jgi:hypothetical protein
MAMTHLIGLILSSGLLGGQKSIVVPMVMDNAASVFEVEATYHGVHSLGHPKVVTVNEFSNVSGFLH